MALKCGTALRPTVAVWFNQIMIMSHGRLPVQHRKSVSDAHSHGPAHTQPSVIATNYCTLCSTQSVILAEGRGRMLCELHRLIRSLLKNRFFSSVSQNYLCE